MWKPISGIWHPPFELAGLFGALQTFVPPDLGYLEKTLGVLESRNFNMKETAQELGIHRNTLAGRLDKLQELWGIDIRGSNEKQVTVSIFHLVQFFYCAPCTVTGYFL